MKRAQLAVAVAIMVSSVGLAGSSAGRLQAPHKQPPLLTATDRDNGRTIGLRLGQRLRVVLSSTYWMFQASSNPTVLRPDGRVRVTPRQGCVAGAGCGTAAATYLGVGPGGARVRATRTSCGEAMGCTEATSRFSLQVLVR